MLYSGLNRQTPQTWVIYQLFDQKKNKTSSKTIHKRRANTIKTQDLTQNRYLKMSNWETLIFYLKSLTNERMSRGDLVRPKWGQMTPQKKWNKYNCIWFHKVSSAKVVVLQSLSPQKPGFKHHWHHSSLIFWKSDISDLTKVNLWVRQWGWEQADHVSNMIHRRDFMSEEFRIPNLK